jgi:hypothetical protein
MAHRFNQDSHYKMQDVLRDSLLVNTCNLCISMGLPSKVTHVLSICLIIECMQHVNHHGTSIQNWRMYVAIPLILMPCPKMSRSRMVRFAGSHDFCSHGTKLTCAPFLCHDYSNILVY